MKITLEIKEQRITDLLHGHCGSYSPWLHSASGKWNSTKGFKVKFDREEDEEGSGNGFKTITAKDVAKGLSLMAVDLPNHWEQFMTEDDDDITFDSIMQYIIFGKLVYA